MNIQRSRLLFSYQIKETASQNTAQEHQAVRSHTLWEHAARIQREIVSPRSSIAAPVPRREQ